MLGGSGPPALVPRESGRPRWGQWALGAGSAVVCTCQTSTCPTRAGPLEGKQTTHACALGFCLVLSLSWASMGVYSPTGISEGSTEPQGRTPDGECPPSPAPHQQGCCPGTLSSWSSGVRCLSHIFLRVNLGVQGVSCAYEGNF